MIGKMAQDTLRTRNIFLVALGAFLAPFVLFILILQNFSLTTVYVNQASHTILLASICAIAFYTAYFSYHQDYLKDKDPQVLFTALAFCVFGLGFAAHAVSVFGSHFLTESVFDVTEHATLPLGAALLTLSIVSLPNLSGRIYKRRVVILLITIALALCWLATIVFAPIITGRIAANIDTFTIIPTGILFAILTLLFIEKFYEKPNTLFVYMVASLAVLINTGIIPLFYQEWNVVWWYFHLVLLAGFGLILIGLIRKGMPLGRAWQKGQKS